MQHLRRRALTNTTLWISVMIGIVAVAFGAKVTDVDFHDYSDPVNNQADGTRWIRATTTTLQFKDANTTTLTLSDLAGGQTDNMTTGSIPYFDGDTWQNAPLETDGTATTIAGPVIFEDYLSDGSTTNSLTAILSASAAMHAAVTLAGAPDYLTIAGQVLTRGLIDLANDTTGTLAASSVDLSAIAANTVLKVSSGTIGGSSISDNGTTITLDAVEVVGGNIEATTYTVRAYEQVTTTGGTTPGSLDEVRHLWFNEATIDPSNPTDDQESATDVSITDDDATDVNMAVTGKLSGGIEFNYAETNNAQYISDTTAITSTNMSIAFWWYNDPAAPGTGAGDFYAIDLTGGTGQLTVDFTAGAAEWDAVLFLNAASPVTITITDTETDLDGWHHYVITQTSGGTWTLTVDETYSESGSGSAVNFSSGAIILGDNGGNHDPTYAGIMDDYREYNAVLDSTQIGLLYNSGAGTETSLDTLQATTGTTTSMQYVNRTLPPAQYGQLFHYSLTTQTLPINTQNTWEHFPHFEEGLNEGVNVDTTSDTLEVISDGVYLVSYSVSAAASNTANFQAAVSFDDTICECSIRQQTGHGITDFSNISGETIRRFSAGHEIKLELRNISNTTDIDIISASLVLRRIGN